MRLVFLGAFLALAACTATVAGTALNPSDSATSIITGGPLTMRVASTPASNDDPLTILTLSRADGRKMQFEEANHAPYDLAVQSAGGALAQAMGLFGQEQPTLYHRRGEDAPFFCAPEGPSSIGVYTAPDGGVTIVGLKTEFQVEDGANGGFDVAPYSPDHVCARLHFSKG